MTLDDFKSVLEETGLPVRYRKFKENEEPVFPCLVYYLNYDDTFSADNRRFFVSQNISVELYTELKDEETEQKVIETAESYGVHLYLIDEYYWPEDRLHEILFETTIY